MRKILPEKLLLLAETSPAKIYLVGGAVRNFLAGLAPSEDYDICGSLPASAVAELCKEVGLQVVACYPKTNTLRVLDGKNVYEYAAFRTERYEKGGTHVPSEIAFGVTLEEDALRRDFTANAVYYDLREGVFVDPLHGAEDITKKVLSAHDPDRIFANDGLRLLRLARFSAELGFTPDEATLRSAKNNAQNIDDISGERIAEELQKILLSDTRYPTSRADAPVFALRLLHQTGVLDRIFPFVTQADGLKQRADFHKYDVLEHTYRAVQYAPPVYAVRLAALLHDCAKPELMLAQGNAHGHDALGKKIARTYLAKLRISKAFTDRVCDLVGNHMFDMDCVVREAKIRRFLVKNEALLPDLFALMQADFSACKDDLSPAPTPVHLSGIYERMKREGAPFSLKELPVCAKDLTDLGAEGAQIGNLLAELWDCAVVNPAMNDREKLLAVAKRKTADKTPAGKE